MVQEADISDYQMHYLVMHVLASFFFSFVHWKSTSTTMFRNPIVRTMADGRLGLDIAEYLKHLRTMLDLNSTDDQLRRQRYQAN